MFSISDKTAEDGFIFLYKDEMIASGTARQVRDALKGILSLKGEKLLAALERMVSIARNSMFKHLSTSGIFIKGNEKVGTYLVGGWQADMRYILEELNYPLLSDFEKLRSGFSFPLPSGQRFNLLNVSEEVIKYFSKKGGFFNRVNAKWVDAAVRRMEDVFILSSRANLYKRILLADGTRKTSLTGFGKEVHRFEWKHGYRYDPRTH